MPYIPFTDEQKQLANSVDLAEYLRVRGEKLERVGIELSSYITTAQASTTV